MITKNQVKALFYLDRDTDIAALEEAIIKQKRSELRIFLQTQHTRLQEKEAGEYFTVEDVTKLKDGELEKMMRFTRGAVIPYYARQSRDHWDEHMPTSMLDEAIDEIKRQVGFMRYDHTGHLTDEVNSLATFERVKDFNEWLKTVEAVCFDDNGYIFPDSEHFKRLEKTKGRDAAARQVFRELLQKVKNLHAGQAMP